jgi:hypothetical protein
MDYKDALIEVYAFFAKHNTVPVGNIVADQASHMVADHVPSEGIGYALIKNLGASYFGNSHDPALRKLSPAEQVVENRNKKVKEFKEYMAKNRIAYGSKLAKTEAKRLFGLDI